MTQRTWKVAPRQMTVACDAAMALTAAREALDATVSRLHRAGLTEAALETDRIRDAMSALSVGLDMEARNCFVRLRRGEETA
jgi:hypothetical protein